MAHRHVGLDPKIHFPEKTARKRARRLHQRPERGPEDRQDREEKPARSWLVYLTASVARDRQERGHLPDLSPEQILAWADAHQARTGQWPTERVGAIPEAPGETWLAVEAALTLGLRGFSRGSTLLRFLTQNWVRCRQEQPDFTVEQILEWADAWHRRTGRRPISTAAGHVPGTDGITWRLIDHALRSGRTNRPGGLSLSGLLIAMRGRYRPQEQLPLTEDQILAWADAHHQRTGSWPKKDSGWIADAPGESWDRMDQALQRGHRSLAGGTSLRRLLAERRGRETRPTLLHSA